MEKKNKKKIKYYKVDENSSLTYAISVVGEPAIESNFIYLSKQKPKYIELKQDDKHLLVGAALIPDFPIYRYDDEEYYIQFSKECIEKLSQNYIKDGFQNNWTADHSYEADGISVVESWIKVDEEKDKSVALGLDAPIGTWFIAAKVENEDIWKQVKDGTFQGFSIEAMVGLNEIKEENFNTNMQKEENTKLEAIEISDGFWDKLRKILSDALGKPQESQEVEETVGKIVDEMEIDGGSKDEKPKVIEQAEENSPKVDEIIKDVIEEVNETASTEEEKEDDLRAIIDGLREEIEKAKAEIESLKSSNEELSKVNDDLKIENEKLSKEPSVKPINASKHDNGNGNFYNTMKSLRDGSYFKK